MSRYASHTLSRLAVYALLWAVGVVLLGLTAYRVHLTKTTFGGYEPIIVELLVSSILTILWVPVAFFTLIKDRIDNSVGSLRIHHELIGVATLWVFWLVGAVDTTNRILPGENYCGISGKQCHILTSILAFSWIGWSLLTVLAVLALLNNAAAALSAAPTNEKRVINQAA